MKKVVVIGAAVIDVLLKSKSLRVLKSHQVEGGVAMCEVMGGKIEAENGILVSGGGGTNVAVGLHRLGEAVKMISRVGDDELGEILVKELVKENVDLSFLQRTKGKTGISAVLVATDGRRSIVTYRGESGEIERNEIDWEEIKKADWGEFCRGAWDQSWS
ncbi:MAG: putative carbohydrate kinase, PfkB [Candidatus Collierbacteria bacterium GW2011_GWF1_42_50]|nr:MAG: putative carbohydrate kinase, PfkB [Candidatus Collierbacteria bacterium GW2011_GWF1_42_50]